MDRLCVGCGIIIDRPFWLCQTCEDQFGVEGVPYQFWPPYLKWLVLDQKREERRGSKPVISLETYLETGVIEPEPDRNALMAYAPYEDEEANRAYRQACGIEERDAIQVRAPAPLPVEAPPADRATLGAQVRRQGER